MTGFDVLDLSPTKAAVYDTAAGDAVHIGDIVFRRGGDPGWFFEKQGILHGPLAKLDCARALARDHASDQRRRAAHMGALIIEVPRER